MSLPTRANQSQRGLFHDPEVGTEAHDDLIAWCSSSTGKTAIADEMLFKPLVAQLPLPKQKEWEIVSHPRSKGASMFASKGYRMTELSARLEVPLATYSGFVAGFADALIRATVVHDLAETSVTHESYEVKEVGQVKETLREIDAVGLTLVEVKTGRIKLGDVLRQMNTYAGLVDPRFNYKIKNRLLIIKQDMPSHYLEAFTNEAIRVARVDEEYELVWLN